MSTDLRCVTLPSDLCEAAEQRFGARFPRVEQLVEFLLREALRQDAVRMDAAEQNLIEKRLKDLGYV